MTNPAQGKKEDNLRQKHVKYWALAHDPNYSTKYPKKGFQEFKRWYTNPQLNPVDKDKFDRELDRDYEDYHKKQVAGGVEILKKYLLPRDPDTDVQPQHSR